MLYRFKIFIGVFLLSGFLGQAQTQITGTILSVTDSLPIPGVAIYFDGTSIGVASGQDGRFSIKTENSLISVLIINALGYKTTFIQDHLGKQDLGYIFLEESQESLEEVHLETDPWSRKKKLEIFKREFLGKTPAALKCAIQNEKDIQLRYIPSTETLVAYADVPLKIVNRYLGYEVTYNLTNFKAEFNSATGLRYTKLVYFEGYSFFKELRKKPSASFLNNRESTFNGSSLHFMRALGSQSLWENGFRIFHDKLEVLPYAFFSIRTTGNLTEVELQTDNLIIVYGPLVQSKIQADGKFFIDRNGNFSPPQSVMFSGEMGNSRFALMLPLNYNL
ncbi:carboxypeptidase-like regulatory domain-containing protein [Antarcticibacterium arcticum]|uniref:Carboxypeptidase-like regulatory domain-containing protein n=1 Tax=Antarcticibacterium arcticum TaxID=2585771 RepID=A0A5B8YJA4_9FLAO|nr:carboxypeptidase-like regulatory domain-containing protein [Antarcticibacterium arcticum]QED37844.1 carboxypeptidase-like regulatory domain-containing protein [Antarcticibacterium arcticum]